MTHEDRAKLRALAEAATEGPWLYRPQDLDDWGWVRTSKRRNGFIPIVACVKSGATPGCEDLDAHRRNRTDPYEANGRFIAECRAAVPELLDALKAAEDRAEKAEAALAKSKMDFEAGEREAAYHE